MKTFKRILLGLLAVLGFLILFLPVSILADSLFGGADQSIPLEQVEAFRKGLEQAGVTHQISIYNGQPHAFVSSVEAIEAGGAQAYAWNEMLLFLETRLKIGSSRQPAPGGFSYSPSFPWEYYAMLVYEHAFGSGSHH